MLFENTVKLCSGIVCIPVCMIPSNDRLCQRNLCCTWVYVDVEELVDFIDIQVCSKFEILTHQVVRDGHRLAKHFTRGFGYADVISKALAHLFVAIGSLKKRRSQCNLRFHARIPLEVSPHKQIE